MNTKYYLHRVGDGWAIEIGDVDAEDFLHAYAVAHLQRAPKIDLTMFPITITNFDTGESETVLSDCPECNVPVFESDEWKVTDAAGVYEHVNCHATDRFEKKGH